MRLKVSVTSEACDYITLYNIKKKKKKRNIESEKKNKNLNSIVLRFKINEKW